MSRTLRDHYVAGKTASFLVATIAQADTALIRLRRELSGAGETRRAHLWDDIDTILERRSQLANTAPVKTP